MANKPNEKKSASGGGDKASLIGVLFVDQASGAQIGFIQFNPSGLLGYRMIAADLHVFAFKPIDHLLEEQWNRDPLYEKHAQLLDDKLELPDEILVQEASSCADFLNSLESPLTLGSYTVKAQVVYNKA
ncbi:MAG: hypothetical protein JW963_21710 [Anaerolineales bacterium]|nr:hypothetical protein [Anaerolineales bacterium]